VSARAWENGHTHPKREREKKKLRAGTHKARRREKNNKIKMKRKRKKKKRFFSSLRLRHLPFLMISPLHPSRKTFYPDLHK